MMRTGPASGGIMPPSWRSLGISRRVREGELSADEAEYVATRGLIGEGVPAAGLGRVGVPVLDPRGRHGSCRWSSWASLIPRGVVMSLLGGDPANRRRLGLARTATVPELGDPVPKRDLCDHDRNGHPPLPTRPPGPRLFALHGRGRLVGFSPDLRGRTSLSPRTRQAASTLARVRGGCATAGGGVGASAEVRSGRCRAWGRWRGPVGGRIRSPGVTAVALRRWFALVGAARATAPRGRSP